MLLGTRENLLQAEPTIECLKAQEKSIQLHTTKHTMEIDSNLKNNLKWCVDFRCLRHRHALVKFFDKIEKPHRKTQPPDRTEHRLLD